MKFKKEKLKKANKFFDAAFESLEKNYDSFCEEFLFLSLFSEKFSSQIFANVIMEGGKIEDITEQSYSILIIMLILIFFLFHDYNI